MPIRIEQMEIPFAPRSILRLFGLESQLVEASPERVHIRHMEDKPTPAVDPLTLLQIEDGRVRVFRTQGREPRSSSAVEHLHAEHIPIELHRGLHVRDPKRHRRLDSRTLNLRLSPHERNNFPSIKSKFLAHPNVMGALTYAFFVKRFEQCRI